MLGELARSEAISRLRLAPLSPAAVAELAEPHGLDPDELYRTTAGNPFFLTEVLAAGGSEIPPTVRDAVLARVARPESGSQDAARGGRDRAAAGRALAPGGARRRAADRLEECLAAGMLRRDRRAAWHSDTSSPALLSRSRCRWM